MLSISTTSTGCFGANKNYRVFLYSIGKGLKHHVFISLIVKPMLFYLKWAESGKPAYVL